MRGHKRIFHSLAAGIGRRLGLGTVRLSGKTALEVLSVARSTLRTQRRGLIVFHWRDADNPKDHESDHPLDRTIPLVLAGQCVLPVELGPVSLLDVPPTVLWAMGVTVPDFHEGRVLREAFWPAETPMTAVA